MERKNVFLFGFLVGAAVLTCLQAVSRSEPLAAYAQTANSNNRMIAATGRIDQEVDALFLVDTDPTNPRLLVYEARQGRMLRLIGARDIQYDMKLRDFVNGGTGKGDPTVSTVEREWKKSQTCEKCGKTLDECKCKRPN